MNLLGINKTKLTLWTLGLLTLATSALASPHEYDCVALGQAPEWVELKDFKLQLSSERALINALEGVRDEAFLPEKNSGYINFGGFKSELSLEAESDLISGGYELAKGGLGGIVKVRQSPTRFQPYLCQLFKADHKPKFSKFLKDL